MDAKKATALHNYYNSCHQSSHGPIQKEKEYWLLDRVHFNGTIALNSGSSHEELSAIEAIAGCDWAPEWAKERYTT